MRDGSRTLAIIWILLAAFVALLAHEVMKGAERVEQKERARRESIIDAAERAQ